MVLQNRNFSSSTSGGAGSVKRYFKNNGKNISRMHTGLQ
jgi:hypothetical protein